MDCLPRSTTAVFPGFNRFREYSRIWRIFSVSGNSRNVSYSTPKWSKSDERFPSISMTKRGECDTRTWVTQPSYRFQRTVGSPPALPNIPWILSTPLVRIPSNTLLPTASKRILLRKFNLDAETVESMIGKGRRAVAKHRLNSLYAHRTTWRIADCRSKLRAPKWSGSACISLVKLSTTKSSTASNCISVKLSVQRPRQMPRQNRGNRVADLPFGFTHSGRKFEGVGEGLQPRRLP